MKKFLKNMMIGAAAASLAAFGAGGAASAQDLPVINFMSTNNTSCSNYPQFVMQEMGYLEEEGFQVNLLNTATTVPVAAFLQNGDADIAVMGPDDVFQAVGAGLPLKVVYETHQVVTDFIVVTADSPIQSIEELDGKVIGLAEDSYRLTTAIALEAADMSIDQVQTAIVGESGPVLARALTEGTVDAYAGGTSARSSLVAAGVTLRSITPPEAMKLVGNSLVVWGPTLEEKRPMITAFLRAWAKSAMAGVVEETAVFMACKTRIPEQWERPGIGTAMLNNSIYNTQLRRTVNFGELQPAIWESMQSPHLASGGLAEPIDVSTILDDSFLDEANSFTTDDVKAGIARFKAANPDMTVPY